MINRRLVLVAIDHATDLKRTMDVAFRTARARGADIHVVRVVPRRAVLVHDHLGRRPFEAHDDHRVNIEARLASIVRAADQDGVRVVRVLLRGEPERVIPAYAQLHQATLLVVESDYGSSRFWRHGRVVNEVARQSPIPLLVLPTRQSGDGAQSELRRILAPVDFSIASGAAMRIAADLSRRHEARVTLLHAMTNVPQDMVFSGSEALEVVRRLPAQGEAVAERLRRRAAFFGAHDVEIEIVTGVVDRAILETATHRDADLVVIGVANRSWLDRLLFGSTLRRVLRRATMPVLVVPVVAGAHAWPDAPVAGQIIKSRERTNSAVGYVAA